MLDPKFIRNEVHAVAEAMKRRGETLDVDYISGIEAQRRTLQNQVQALQSARNLHAKKVGHAKASGGDVESLLSEVKNLGDELSAAEKAFSAVLAEQNDYFARLPNIPHVSVPDGKSEADNVVLRTIGEPTCFDFIPKDHVELGAQYGMDFSAGAKLSGARFVVLHETLSKLQRALVQFMLDLHTKEHGYKEVSVPFLVNGSALFGTGQLPKMAEDLFSIESENPLYLIPTAEVPVTNLVADSILELDQLPLRFVCHSHCFRSEAGSYGKDTRGMIRQHQFEKVELVQIVHPDHSFDILEQLTGHAEKVLQLLNIPYRVVALCAGDLGFYSSKTYDLEVWLPGQQAYREISSCSNTQDFQARRMKARYRDSVSGKPELVHTLNGSALAIGRTLVAILENYQEQDGRVRIPDVLRPYMGSDALYLV